MSTELSSILGELRNAETRLRGLEKLEAGRFRGRGAMASNYLGDPNPLVRNQALQCVRSERAVDDGTLNKVRESLKNSDSLLKIDAIEYFVGSRYDKAMSEIAPLIDDKDGLVSAYAIWAATEFKWKLLEGKITCKSPKSTYELVSVLEYRVRVLNSNESLSELKSIFCGTSGSEKAFASAALRRIALENKKWIPEIKRLYLQSLKKPNLALGLMEAISDDLREVEFAQAR
ncbi:MAG: hypothetical protein ACOZAA_06440 [Pseudomonadota bacterium]